MADLLGAQRALGPSAATPLRLPGQPLAASPPPPLSWGGPARPADEDPPLAATPSTAPASAPRARARRQSAQAPYERPALLDVVERERAAHRQLDAAGRERSQRVEVLGAQVQRPANAARERVGPEAALVPRRVGLLGLLSLLFSLWQREVGRGAVLLAQLGGQLRLAAGELAHDLGAAGARNERPRLDAWLQEAQTHMFCWLSALCRW